MPLPQAPQRPSRRLATAVAVSIVAHLLALPFLARGMVFKLPAHSRRSAVSLVTSPRAQQRAGQTQPGQVVVPSLQPTLPPAALPVEPTPPEEQAKLDKIDGQIVSLGQPQDERAPTAKTRFLSEHDSRVAKETRARETSAFFKNALSKVQKEGRDHPTHNLPQLAQKPSGEEGENGGRAQVRAPARELPSRKQQSALNLETAPDGIARNRAASEALNGAGKRIAMTEQPSERGPEGVPGALQGRQGARGPLKLSLDSPADALGPLAGGPMPDDLRDVEEGNETLLNSRSFRFAGFLNRVKETVGRIWVTRVQDEAQHRDPTGQLFSYKDRRTVVEFTLDKAGEVRDVKVAVSCGVDYLDRTAVEAFKSAERFPNPPPGLVGDDGTVRLPFAFTLLAATGGVKLSIGPAYLPNSPAARGY